MEAGDIGGVVLGGVAAGLTVEAYHQGADACQADTVGVCQLLGYHVAELCQHGQHIAAFHTTVALYEARQLVGLYGAEVDGLYAWSALGCLVLIDRIQSYSSLL